MLEENKLTTNPLPAAGYAGQTTQKIIEINLALLSRGATVSTQQRNAATSNKIKI